MAANRSEIAIRIFRAATELGQLGGRRAGHFVRRDVGQGRASLKYFRCWQPPRENRGSAEYRAVLAGGYARWQDRGV